MSNTQATNYSPEYMDIYKEYAARLRPTPRPTYAIVHDQYPTIQVPAGCLPIRIAQFAPPNGRAGLRHWAIFIPTSDTPGVGNFYEISGNIHNGYFMQWNFNCRHPMWNDERGSHVVGWVAPGSLATFHILLSMALVEQGNPQWNEQMWVVDALNVLNRTHMFAVQMGYAQWYQQMEIVEKAWKVGKNV